MTHCNTIFHQRLKLIPKHHVAKLEAENKFAECSTTDTPGSEVIGKNTDL